MYLFTILFLIIVYLGKTILPNLTLETSEIFLTHFAITFPSTIFHTIINKYRRFTIFTYDKTPLYDKNVVVFVHGRNGYFTDPYPLMDNLHDLLNVNHRDQSPKAINLQYLIDEKYYLRTVYLEETANTFIEEDMEKLKEELKVYENCSIILVGISKGGVTVANCYVLAGDKRIKKAITISSPLLGTQIASAFPNDSAVYKALSYQNDQVKTNELAAKQFGHLYHIVPRFDHLIIPTTAAYYETTPKERIYHYEGFLYSHSGICYNYDIAKKIATWIA